jgi:hypothetical protein
MTGSTSRQGSLTSGTDRVTLLRLIGDCTDLRHFQTITVPNVTIPNERIQARYLVWGFVLSSLVFGALAAHAWLTPQFPPFTGKWAPIKELLHSVFGRYGLPGFWFSLAALDLFVARWVWLRVAATRP